MKVIAFAASNSTKSINKQLVTYAANLLEGATIEILDLNDYEMPLYSEDKEAELGQPELAQAFLNKISSSDAIIISFAEHNGSYTAAYKNIFDWCSRITQKVYQNKAMVLLSTSPGKGGASNVLNMAINAMPHFNGQVKGSLSIPNFYDNFDVTTGQLKNHEINAQLTQITHSLLR